MENHHQSESLSLYILHKTPGIGQERMLILLRHFGSAQASLTASREQLLASGLSPRDADAIYAQYTLSCSDDVFALDWATYSTQGIDVVSIVDPRYPDKLHGLTSAPALLYFRGSLNLLDESSVAVVGSRKFTQYGQQSAMRLSYDLAAAGIVIVSGLALGIDAIAHKATLESRTAGHAHARTIAVLGGGIDDSAIAPRAHYALAHDIISAGGALISIFTPGTAPNKGTFPARNALMALMTDATLIIEAAHKSGTLITADLARDFEKPVFAVPGSIFSSSGVGSNQLISSGHAQLIQSADDVLRVLNIPSSENHHTDSYVPQTEEESIIYALLQEYPNGVSIDKIVRESTLEGGIVSSTLVMLEIDGVIVSLAGGHYTLR